MEDVRALEEFLALLDETERVVKGDAMAEDSRILSYSVEAKKVEAPKPPVEEKEDLSSCHLCMACMSRTVYAEPILNQNPEIMFITASPEGSSILDTASYDYFVKWINSIGLRRKDIALTSLVKCPVPRFDRKFADACKIHLKDEMTALKPKAMVLLGFDAASYMLRRGTTLEDLRGRKYSVNSIPVFVTYTPHELYLNRNLRRAVWDDLQFIAKSLGLGGQA